MKNRNLATRLKWTAAGISPDPQADILMVEQSAAFPLGLLFRENYDDLEEFRRIVKKDLRSMPCPKQYWKEPLDTYQDAARLIHNLLQEDDLRPVAHKLLLLLATPYVRENDRQLALRKEGRGLTFRRDCPESECKKLLRSQSLQERQETLVQAYTHMGELFPAMRGNLCRVFHGTALRCKNSYYGWLYQRYLAVKDKPFRLPGIAVPYVVALLYDSAQDSSAGEQEKSLFLLQCAIVEPYWEKSK